MGQIKVKKNDQGWEILFNKHSILDVISKQGYFQISSAQINEVRESRLMTKFDNYENLPKIFKEHKLSILPISRSKYVIGNFNIHHKLKYESQIEEIYFESPENLETIKNSHIYSEHSALLYAFNAGIIDDLIGEKTCYTVAGRMSSETFDLEITNITNNSLYNFKIKNSQCEIDGGFESENYFLIIEAKNYSVDNFCVRQLYYPYRLWSSKITKLIIPILMIYSNDKFTFFIFNFQNGLSYNSIKCIKQKQYLISSEEITTDDVSEIFNQIKIMPESRKIPFPQADLFERVIDLLSLLMEKDLTPDEITYKYQFHGRQTGYYTNAVIYIGLVERYKDQDTKKMRFRLTHEGRTLLKKSHKHKILALIQKILQHQVFYLAFKLAIENGKVPEKDRIEQIISQNNLNITGKTISRRSQTVRGWIKWIWEQIE